MKKHSKILLFILIAVFLTSLLPSTSMAASLKISSIKNLSATVYINQRYNLPQVVAATMSNKTTKNVGVTWDKKTAVTSKAGTFVFKGTVKGYSKKVLLTLKVVAVPASVADTEILRAIAYGFVPGNLQSNLNETITYKQYCQMLTSMISKYDSSYLTQWEKRISAAGVSDDKMLREDGILTMSYAAVMMNAISLNWDTDTELGISQQEMDNQMKQLSWNYKYFPDWNNVAYTYNKSNYMWGGVQFFAQKRSLVSSNAIYPYDYKAHSMHLNEPLTRHDAVLAVLRFYESQHKKINADSAKNGTVSSKAKALAENMPQVSSSGHPNWYGSSMDFHNLYRKGNLYATNEDIAKISGMGFNYLRLILTYEDFTEDQNDTLVFYRDALENIDRIMEWCAEYKIHVCLDMHDLPGYSSGYSEDKLNILENHENYQKALLIWNVLSSRYADVPSNLLSYNLINEPNFYFSDDSYAGFAKAITSVIQNNDKTQKLLVSDGMLGGEWEWAGACPSRPNKLIGNTIMQTIHLYPWHALNKSGYLSLESWPYEHAQPVNNIVNGDTPFYIKGDFKAGTVVTIYINSVYGIKKGSALICKADGSEIVSLPMDGFTIGKDNCSSIKDDVAEFGDNGKTNGWTVKFTVPSACHEISISPIGGAGISIHELFMRLPSDTEHTYGVPQNSIENGFVYETGKYTTVYIHCADVWDKKTSSITISANGSYTVENEANCDVFDYETLRAYIKKWADWSKSTGTPIMCNEFGVPVSLSGKARIEYMRSVLELFKEYNISWCIYTNDWQCWTPRVPDVNVKQGGTILPADGSLTLSNGFWYDNEMLKLLHEYMK